MNAHAQKNDLVLQIFNENEENFEKLENLCNESLLACTRFQCGLKMSYDFFSKKLASQHGIYIMPKFEFIWIMLGELMVHK